MRRVATPGWYPDPAGQPGAFRYWDGVAWGSDLTGDPASPPPGPAFPPAPPAPPAARPPAPPADVVYQGYPGASYPSNAGGGGSGSKVALLAVGAVALMVALAVGTYFVVGLATGDDDTATGDGTSTVTTSDPTTDPTTEPTTEPTTDPTTDPTTEPTTDPTSDPTGAPAVDPFTDPAEPTDLQCFGGRPKRAASGLVGDEITGGGLAMPTVPGFTSALDTSTAFEFADGVTAPGKQIEEKWVAVYALGGLNRDNGFTGVGQAASTVLECMSRSPNFYNGFSGGTVLGSRPIEVGGAPAWEIAAEIRIDDPEVAVEGDVATVVVVDLGDPAGYGLFVSVVPIGNQALIDQQETQVGYLHPR